MLQSKGHSEVVIIGGASTVSEFLKAGIVNELYLVIEPVLFDGGLPVLKEVKQDFKLSLASVKQLNANTVELHYLIN